MKTIKNVDFDDKRVLIRVDFNVPLDNEGNITSDTRIRESIPTIKYVIEHNCKQIILMSHLGKPDGKVVDKLKMDKVSEKLEKLLDMLVVKLDDCVDIKIPDAKIVMLENLRFHAEEESNDEEFSRKLSKLGDIYVNDAFGTMHRAHASTVGVTKFIPGCIGFLVEKELNYLTLKNPERPFIAILGGSKISTKIPVIKELLKKVDYLLLGGAMIFTLYKAKGSEIGKSLCEDNFLTEGKMLLNNEKIILPDDIVCASEKTADADIVIANEHQIPKEMIGLDIGPESIQLFKDYLKKAKTVFWNGPLGYFEIEKFGESTREIAEYLAGTDKVVIIGGGDTEEAILPFKDKFTHVSTGGGASLEYISGKELPAIRALKENEIDFHNVI
jgi:phosphoglycerate kinase